MSLVYCNYGSRDYRRKPVPVQTRGYWEFQINLSGKNRPSLPSGTPETWNENHNFWIFSPDSRHGWQSYDRGESEIAVFHFSEVPQSLSVLFKTDRILSARADGKALDSIAALAEEVYPYVNSPDYLSSLRFDICCKALCIMFLKDRQDLIDQADWDRGSQVVGASIAWFCSHMHEGVGVREAAEKMNYSVSQFRKLFSKAKGVGPGKVFEGCRMSRARELIDLGQMSMLEIALECGYNCHSSFSRAFRKYFNLSPVQYRNGFPVSSTEQ